MVIEQILTAQIVKWSKMELNKIQLNFNKLNKLSIKQDITIEQMVN